ncbi:hypothetical protein FO519_000050 [Halicephalobus sp. NKZ332]|nr:hypothetical protein FO519_000050 [Halicephalobus sp. NKZ332]
MGQSASVLVKNDFLTRIKVKLESSKSFPQLVKIDNNGNSNTSIGFSNNNPCEYEVFYVVPSGESSTILNVDESKKFYLEGCEAENVFLTIWVENNDNSWTIYCESHPIMKFSKVNVTKLMSGDPYLIVDPTSTYKIRKMKRKKGVHVVNYSSKKIWVRIDSDNLEETKKTLIPNSNYFVEDTVYCRAQQGQGYTPISAEKEANFFMDTPKNRFYISIDYETTCNARKLKKYYVLHPLKHSNWKSLYLPWIEVLDSGEAINLFHNFGARLASVILVPPSEEIQKKWKAAAENFGLQNTLYPITKSRAREIYYLSKFTDPKIGDLGVVVELSNDSKTTKWKVDGEVLEVEGDDVIKAVSKISKETESSLDELRSTLSAIPGLKWKVIGVPDDFVIENSDDFEILPIKENTELRGAQIMARYLSGFRDVLYFGKN